MSVREYFARAKKLYVPNTRQKDLTSLPKARQALGSGRKVSDAVKMSECECRLQNTRCTNAHKLKASRTESQMRIGCKLISLAVPEV